MNKNLPQNIFSKAVEDYQFLLERQYPKKAILKIIGDRYLLTGIERTILFRGVSMKKKSVERKLKVVKEILRQNIHIDGYNVLITIGSYLNGNMVFISKDGFLRDASEAHGKILRSDLIERSLDLMLDYLKQNKPTSVNLYFDAPVSNSKSFSDFVNQKIEEFEIDGKSEVVDSPDFVLKSKLEGICCTSDSEIIDSAQVKIFDLAKNTLVAKFKPKFYVVR
jgi:hypothetical protein